MTLPARHPFTSLLKCPLFMPGPVLVPGAPHKLALESHPRRCTQGSELEQPEAPGPVGGPGFAGCLPLPHQGVQIGRLQGEAHPCSKGTLRIPWVPCEILEHFIFFMLVFAHKQFNSSFPICKPRIKIQLLSGLNALRHVKSSEQCFAIVIVNRY